MVWWSPAPPLFTLPQAARVGRCLQSSAAPVVVSQNDLMFCCCRKLLLLRLSLLHVLSVSHALCLSLALLRGDQPRMHLNCASTRLHPRATARLRLSEFQPKLNSFGALHGCVRSTFGGFPMLSGALKNNRVQASESRMRIDLHRGRNKHCQFLAMRSPVPWNMPCHWPARNCRQKSLQMSTSHRKAVDSGG